MKIKYSSGEEVELNDKVKVIQKRIIFQKQIFGTVNYIPDYDKPFEREKNDYGINIKINEERSIWCGANKGVLGENVILEGKKA